MQQFFFFVFLESFLTLKVSGSVTMRMFPAESPFKAPLLLSFPSPLPLCDLLLTSWDFITFSSCPISFDLLLVRIQSVLSPRAPPLCHFLFPLTLIFLLLSPNFSRPYFIKPHSVFFYLSSLCFTSVRQRKEGRKEFSVWKKQTVLVLCYRWDASFQPKFK